MHAVIGVALNCIGYVTNGAVRDLPAVKELGFHLFSGSVSVSHAYAHLVDFGDPVTIGGLKISPGDLIHGDRHGVQTIPLEHAERIPEEAEKVKCIESQLRQFCQSPEFSLDGLAEKLKQVAQDCK
jgi:regulator of RNase E activity RraA